MLVIVIDHQTNKSVLFREVNNAVPVPITRDTLRPSAVRVSDNYCDAFTTAIIKKGWYLRQITI